MRYAYFSSLELVADCLVKLHKTYDCEGLPALWYMCKVDYSLPKKHRGHFIFALLQVMALIIMRQRREKYPRWERDLFESLGMFNSGHNGLYLQFRRFMKGFPRVQDQVKTSARQPGLNGQLASTEYQPGQTIPDTGFELSGLKRDSKIPLPSLKLTQQDVNRWKMAKQAAESFKKPADHCIFSRNPFERRCTNLPGLANVLRDNPLVFGLSAAAMVYGGLHALAWSAHFHSPTEQLLWRTSSVIVMGGYPTFLTSLHLAFSFDRTPLYALSFLIASAYVLARLYLVVECFIQLSHLPAGVYEVPEWSAYFPHIA